MGEENAPRRFLSLGTRDKPFGFDPGKTEAAMWSARPYVSTTRTKEHNSEFSATMTPWTLQHCIGAFTACKKSLHKATRLQALVKWRNRKGRPVVRPIGCWLLTAPERILALGYLSTILWWGLESVFTCALPCHTAKSSTLTPHQRPVDRQTQPQERCDNLVLQLTVWYLYDRASLIQQCKQPTTFNNNNLLIISISSTCFER